MVTGLYKRHVIKMRLQTHKADVVILLTVVILTGGLNYDLSNCPPWSVGLSIQNETKNAAPLTLPSGRINLLPFLAPCYHVLEMISTHGFLEVKIGHYTALP